MGKAGAYPKSYTVGVSDFVCTMWIFAILRTVVIL